MTYVMSTELYHHGIKGQKWGIRRFQNPDGTLTEAGRKRYGTVENLKAKRTLKQINKEESEKKKAISSGKVADIQKISTKLTDEEMAEAFKRISYEQKLAQLKNTDIANGQEKAAKIVAAGATIKDAAKTMTEIYNIAAQTYNAFSKTDNKLPVIGEKKESIDDLTKKFNLMRDKQRFQWEKEDRNKPKEEKVDWNNEVKRIQYMNAFDARNEKKAKEAAEKILNDPQFGRTYWEKATYSAEKQDFDRAAWEKKKYA